MHEGVRSLVASARPPEHTWATLPKPADHLRPARPRRFRARAGDRRRGGVLTLRSLRRAAWRRPRDRFSAVRWRVTALGRGGAPTSPLPAGRPARRPAAAPSRRSASRSRPPSRADAQRACATRAGATKLGGDGLARAASACGTGRDKGRGNGLSNDIIGEDQDTETESERQ